VVHPLKNVLNKLRWDPAAQAEDYLITYRHRGAPEDVVKVLSSHIKKLGKSYFTISENSESEETVIPFHRILEIHSLSNGKIIWKSRKVTR